MAVLATHDIDLVALFQHAVVEPNKRKRAQVVIEPAVVNERFKRRGIVRFGRGDASDYRL